MFEDDDRLPLKDVISDFASVAASCCANLVYPRGWSSDYFDAYRALERKLWPEMRAILIEFLHDAQWPLRDVESRRN